MPKNFKLLPLLILSVLAISCGRGDEVDAPAERPTDDAAEVAGALSAGLSAINREGIEKHLLFLADDARKGRMTGSPEYDEAAAYVAEQFAQIGLEAGGEDGGWFQAVPLLSRQIEEDSATLVFHQDGEASAQRWKEDFVMGGDVVRPQTEVTAEVVFAGYGVHAPELGYSDYDGIDVDGKIVAIFGGAPATFHMKAATSPMVAIEALRLDAAYVAVGKALGLPTQAYMALSDSKFIDAQAGAETFGSALLAALAGVNSVSGPGMLDYVMVFSLAKLVVDDELCGQALAFIRDTKPVEDLPTLDLVRELLAEQNMLTADHTMKHWQQELYLPGSVIDRDNWDNWTKAGKLTLDKRAANEVERRLAIYTQVETDARIDAEMRRLIALGMVEKRPLPPVAPHIARPNPDPDSGQRKRHRRQRR